MATTSDGRPLVTIKGHGKMRNYIEFCLRTLRADGRTGVVLRGEEKQLDKCVSVSEIVKRRWTEAEGETDRGKEESVVATKCVSKAVISNALAFEGGPIRPRIEITMTVEAV